MSKDVVGKYSYKGNFNYEQFLREKRRSKAKRQTKEKTAKLQKLEEPLCLSIGEITGLR
ncbi:hypothetical protein KLF50_14890 (plasmid) [Clostridium perfringens]|uniref:hypothetical protein n=1 Tax=Clostridium perfringens TaxID=1502 RepID=UPI001CCE4D9D|nr:hypothetical protein [Clostridium perfringens]UBK83450.1 hypothetical protein KLF50_14890 [Clostridium perfringens]